MISTSLLAVFMPIVGILLWKSLNWLWLRPKKIEKLLRRQGLKGNSYKIYFGDVTEFIDQTKASLLTQITLSDDHLLRIAAFFCNTVKKYGKNCFAWIGPVPWLIVTDPEKVKEVLTRYEDFQKPNHPSYKKLLVGLFVLEGETWVKHRKIMNPAFHMERLKDMYPAVYESCSKMLASWENLVSKSGSVELDVWPFIDSLTGDVISTTAFGSCYKGGKVLDLLKEHAKLSLDDPETSNYIPGWRFLPTKKNRRVKALCKETDELLRRMIESRKQEIQKGEINKNDLLGILLESNMREIKAHDKGKGLTTTEVIQECKFLYLAGADTTSTLLVWALVSLSKYQIWQERARDEVFQIFGRDGKPNFERLSQLKIVNMILYEVLRFYSPVHVLLRKVYEDVELGELLVPAGTELVLPLCMIHQDCDNWGKDAKEFNPGRFAEGISKATKGQSTYFPFSFGPRICIGQNFSLLEAKLTLTMILQRFSLDLSPSYVHAPYAVITVKPQYGANIILHKL